MPWCDHCTRYLAPNTVRPDFSCPWCGRFVDPGRLARDAIGTVDDALPPVPWHLKALMGAAAVYLGWRAVQGVAWVADRWF